MCLSGDERRRELEGAGQPTAASGGGGGRSRRREVEVLAGDQDHPELAAFLQTSMGFFFVCLRLNLCVCTVKLQMKKN